MNQCVPSWDLDADPTPPPPPPPPQLHLNIPLFSSSSSHPTSLSPVPAVVPMAADFEVAELTWENGNISSRGISKPAMAGIAWVKQPQQLSGGGGGTLEEVVNFALPPPAAAVDLLVPCGRDEIEPRKRARVVGEDGRVRVCAASQGSAAPGRGESTLVTCGGGGAGEEMAFTTTTNNSTSLSPLDGEGSGSPETENASIGGGGANESGCHSQRSKRDMVCDGEENMEAKVETGRASISTKRSRAAAVHNESERKRRDRINQKMKTLQRLVPNSSKTDKASMLDEVIDYLKQLQTQVNMMSRMMMPMAAMPPLQMSMMANMAQMAQMAQMGMGPVGMSPPMVNLGSMGQPTGYPGMPTPGMPPLLHPSTFAPFNAGWDGASDRLKQQAGASAMPSDPFSAFLACQAAQQSVSMDAYSRIAALYQQMFQQNQPPNSKP